MATIRHKRIQLLQSFVPRLTDPSTIILIEASSNVLQYKVDTSPTTLIPSTTVTLTATTQRNGTITWDVVGGPITGISLSTTTGTSTVLTYTNSVVVDTVTIRATVTTPQGMYSTTTENKTLVLTVQKPAQSTRSLTLYRQGVDATTVPGAISGSLTYNYSTSAFVANTSGWVTTPPTNPTFPIYFSTRDVSTYAPTNTTAIDISTGWSAPTNITQNGVSPPILTLSTTGFVYIFKDDTTATQTSPDITLTANLVNSTDTINWTAVARNSAGTQLGNIATIHSTTGVSKTLTSVQFTLAGNVNVKYVEITATAGSLQDSITIYRGDSGQDALNLILSNEAHTVPANVDGSSPNLTGASTLIKVFKGLADITNTATITATVLTGTITPATIGGTALDPTYTVATLGQDVATVRIRAVVGTTTLDKVFTISKSKAGQIGTVLAIDQSGGAFIQAKSGAIAPTTISLTANVSPVGSILQPTYQWYKNGTTLGAGAQSATYAVPQSDYQAISTNAYKCIVTGTINGIAGQTREDQTTLVKVIDGSNVTTVSASNDNMGFSGPNTGYAGISFTGTTCVFTAYLGSTLLSYASSGANTFSAVVGTNTGVTVAAGTGTGTTFTVPLPTAMQADVGSTEVTLTVRNEANLATTFTRTITYTLSRVGVPGIAGASVDIIYSRQPATPTPTTPTASPGVPTIPASTWYTDIQQVPAGTNPVWQSTGRKIPPSTDFIWDTPKIISGTSIVELTIFIRSANPPPTLLTPAGGTYNFVTKVLTPPSTWSTTFPTGGVGTNPVYTSRTSVSTSDPTQTSVAVSGWQTPVLTVQNGEQGDPASVTIANVAAAITANSSTPITMANSNLFQTAASGARVFIGQGGITGTTGSKTTFAIDASTGSATFSGKITGAELDIDSSFGSTNGISFKNAGITKGSIYIDAAAGSGYTGTVLETKLTTSSAATHILATNNTSGTYYTQSLTVAQVGASNYFLFKGPDGSASLQSQGGSFQIQAINGLSAANVNILSGISGGDIQLGAILATPLARLQVYTKNFKLTGDSGETYFIGAAPKLILDRAGSQPWEIRHDAGNLVINYKTLQEIGNNINDFIFSDAGNFEARGNVTAYSDKAIKTHIRPISQATSKLKQINGYQYKNLLANKHDCGIIAQEIEKILPELVMVGSTEFEGTKLKTVNYNGVVALLVAANRELISRVEALERQVHDVTSNRSNKLS